MSDQPVIDFANRLRACLDAADSDAALIALIAELETLIALPRIPRTKWYEEDGPHSIVGLATALTANALIRANRANEVRQFLDTIADVFWQHRREKPGHNFESFALRFPYLWAPQTVAAIASQNWEDAVEAVVTFAEYKTYGQPPPDPEVENLLSHSKIGIYGPFQVDRHWVLDRQEEIVRLGSYDRNLEVGREFEALFVENALLIEQPTRALPLIENLREIYVRGGDTSGDHFEFNAVCAFAALGRFDEALAMARAMVRQGYYLKWRFAFERAAGMQWTQKMRQNEWLSALSQTPQYQAFLQEIAYAELDKNSPATNPLCAVRDGVLGGKKKKRCWLTQKLIAPGDPIVRMRRLFDHGRHGDFDIVEKTAFEESPWELARKQFESDRVPIAALFPEPRRLPRSWKAPAIAAFHYDVAYDPAAFDLRRAMHVVAAHAPRKIRLNWQQGPKERVLAFKPWVGDEGHGDAVNFTWLLLKAGCGAELFRFASQLPPAQADKVFAMFAIFDRTDCRSAAAEHFGLPDLPAMMALALSERPTLKAHLAIADFGHENPRWRAGLVSAMQAYALHLYSNYHPSVDWFLQDLEHFSLAGGCQLLYFLIHHPEDDEVLATMIEKEWLPTGVGGGAYDAYDNAKHFYYRVALFNRMLHAPERLDFWLRSEWLNKYCHMAKDRETRRLAEQWLKAKSGRKRR
jgi:hypothetical protein